MAHGKALPAASGSSTTEHAKRVSRLRLRSREARPAASKVSTFTSAITLFEPRRARANFMGSGDPKAPWGLTKAAARGRHTVCLELCLRARLHARLH